VIANRRAPTASVWAVVCARDDGARATAALAAYDEENRPRVRRVDMPPGQSFIGLGIAVALLLLGFFALTGSRATGAAWFERGSASAGRMLRGEMWRAVTALTLHAD